MPIVQICDLIDPDDADGRSYREVNAAKNHLHSVGALVQLDNGVRLYVVDLCRDCDSTPLYKLSWGPGERAIGNFDLPADAATHD